MSIGNCNQFLDPLSLSFAGLLRVLTRINFGVMFDFWRCWIASSRCFCLLMLEESEMKHLGSFASSKKYAFADFHAFITK